MPDFKDAFRYRQLELHKDALSGHSPRISTRADNLEAEAQKHLSKEVFAFVSGGAGKEKAVVQTRKAFEKWAIRPRVLTDIEDVDTSVQMFGQDFHTPLMLCPLGYQVGAHKNGDMETARAALNEHTPMIISMQAGFPIEDIARALHTTPKWMQLYWSNQAAFNKNIIKRAETSGCSAIVITLDAKMLGWRPRDLDANSSLFTDIRFFAQYTSDPVLREILNNIETPKTAYRSRMTVQALRNKLRTAWNYPGDFFSNILTGRSRKEFEKLMTVFGHQSLNWDDIAAIKKMTKLPIVLKGVLHPEDAKLALKHKVDGIIVSSHGGRQLSSCVASLDALPDIANVVKGKIPVLFDSGIQGGADMFKAIALGADAVGVGRPYYYALSIAGAVGVRELIRNLNAEFYTTMALSGCTRVEDIKPECLVRV